jgi:hypothetical protein
MALGRKGNRRLLKIDQEHAALCSSAAFPSSHHLAKPGPEERRGAGGGGWGEVLRVDGLPLSVKPSRLPTIHPSTFPARLYVPLLWTFTASLQGKDHGYKTDELTEAQSGKVVCPRPHSWEGAGLNWQKPSVYPFPQCLVALHQDHQAACFLELLLVCCFWAASNLSPAPLRKPSL